VSKPGLEEHRRTDDDRIDEAGAQSFPASDSPPWTSGIERNGEATPGGGAAVIRESKPAEGEGDPFDVSDADTMLRYLDPSAQAPRDILLFTKPGCEFCAKARKLLDARGWAYEEVSASPRRLRALSAKNSTPQIFIDGTYIGGADDLQTYLARTT